MLYLHKQPPKLVLGTRCRASSSSFRLRGFTLLAFLLTTPVACGNGSENEHVIIQESSSLSSNRDRGSWVFDGAANQNVLLRASSDDFDTAVRLLAPTGDTVAWDNDGGPGTDSMVVARLPTSGQYQVQVGAMGRGFGAYVVSVLAVDVVAPLEMDTWTPGVLERSNAMSFWKFKGKEGDIFSIEVSSDDFDHVVQVAAPSGNEIAHGDSDSSSVVPDSRAVFTARESGWYEVRLSSSDGQFGAYELAVRTLPAAVLDMDTRAEGVLNRRDGIGIWVFDGEEDQTVSVETRSEDFDARLQLVDMSNAEISSDDNSDPFSVTDALSVVTLRESGSYQVRVTSSDGRLGAYEVAVSTVRAKSPRLGEWNNDELTQSHEMAFWTFDGSRDKVVTVDVRSTDFDTTVQLVGPDGEELAWNNDSGPGGSTDSFAWAILDRDARHVVRVSASDSRFGKYRMNVHTADAAYVLGVVQQMIDGCRRRDLHLPGLLRDDHSLFCRALLNQDSDAREVWRKRNEGRGIGAGEILDIGLDVAGIDPECLRHGTRRFFEHAIERRTMAPQPRLTGTRSAPMTSLLDRLWKKLLGTAEKAIKVIF